MDEPTRFVTAPELVPNALYDKALFHRKLIELGVDGPLDRPGPGRARRPVHARRARAPHPQRSPAALTASSSASSSRSPRGCWPWPRPTTRSATQPELHVSERIIFPVVADREPTASRMRGSSGSSTTTAGPLLRDLHGLRRPGDPAPDPRDRRLPPLQGQHPERARGAEQGLRPVPAEGQRPLRHAFAAGQREHLPDVLGHAPLLVHQGADRQADVSLGVRPARQLRLADRDRGGLAGADPRRRPDAQVRPWAPSCSTCDDPSRVIGRLEAPLLEPERQRARGLRAQRRLQLRRRSCTAAS